MGVVVLTDHAWPDVEIERQIVENAGHQLDTRYATATAAEIEEVVADARPAGILTCWAQVSARAIASAPDLRIVARMGVGLDNIAVSEATRRGIWVTNVPDYCVEEVSDHALALMLAWVRGVTLLDRQVRGGSWDPSTARLRRVATLTAGILGYGRIGQRTAAKLAGFGMRVLALRPRSSIPPAGPAEIADLETVLAHSDVLIVHLPLTTETHHIVDVSFLQRMRPGSLLVNVSRGALVDNAALLQALETGPLAAAALDVVEGEPHPPSELVQQPNAIFTPHVGFASDTSVIELRTRATQEVVRVLAGKRPAFPCNSPAVARA